MTTSRAAQIAQTSPAAITGTWQRHSAARWANNALDGHRSNGRWGTLDGFDLIYLGTPRDSVIVEAYRHLVDPVEDPLPPTALAPRVLITVHVDVTNLLDLRSAGARMSAGLDISDLTSATTNTAAYERCREVAQIAHQLGRHGLVAPAATAMGETLVLFADLLPEHEHPRRLTQDEYWDQLPPDPRQPQARRHLRAVPDGTD